MRRTYISIALRANGFDVKWVMGQVGHANSAMTMDVYAQLQQRVNRRHGTAFDALLRDARSQREDVDWATIGPRELKTASEPNRASEAKAKKKPAKAGFRGVARPGLEPGTPRFSGAGNRTRWQHEIPADRQVRAGGLDPARLPHFAALRSLN